MTTAYVYHPIFLEHNTGWKHPEKSQRLVAIRSQLTQSGLWDQLRHLTPEPAPLKTIQTVHDASYVQALKALCTANRIFDAGNEAIGSSNTFDAALVAAGAVLAAIDVVMDRRAANAFCAVRPPGHHAEHDHAMGFCFFNNVALGARYLQQRYAVNRVAILDWDVHHGNGTQNAFYSDPSVFYCSTHQFPLYPGSGRADETGTGPGSGYTLNLPMAAGSTGTDYLEALTHHWVPAMRRFQPEFILISAGFDGHRDDPLAQMMLTEDDFAAMTRVVMDVASECAGGRVVSVLEGGYGLRGLAASVEAHLRELMRR